MALLSLDSSGVARNIDYALDITREESNPVIQRIVRVVSENGARARRTVQQTNE